MEHNHEKSATPNITEFMTFELGKMKYAIELPKIKEILTYPDNITILPNTSDWVKGLINSRGEVVPILDIRIKFNTGFDYAVYSKDKRVLYRTFSNEDSDATQGSNCAKCAEWAIDHYAQYQAKMVWRTPKRSG